jgi:hypothetical protein
MRAYAATWTATILYAALVVLLGATARAPVRYTLGLRLRPDPQPRLGHVLALAAHNIPIAAWPLLLGVLGADRHRLGQKVADCALLACILVNTLPVGAALGAYGAPLLPYIPQLPVEWAGLALGASGWLLQRRRALTAREGLVLLALIACVLLGAAAIETVAVPHR